MRTGTVRSDRKIGTSRIRCRLRYKSDVEVPPNLSDDLKHCADVIAETDEDMQRIAKDLGVLR